MKKDNPEEKLKNAGVGDKCRFCGWEVPPEKKVLLQGFMHKLFIGIHETGHISEREMQGKK